MKFIHTADWHLGKIVHGIHMTEEQREMLVQFVQLVEEEQPDAVIIAGDLYDRSVPPTEAVELLDEILFKINVEMKIPVVAIAGNHDSAERLSFGTSWYKQSRLFIQGKLSADFTPVQIGGVNFYSIPYAEPGTVRYLLDDSSIHSHQDAMKALVGKIEEKLNPNEPNVLVGHAFVLGGKTSDSERSLSVGGSGCVSADLFDCFHYTAMGHLHSPDAIKHPKVYYSGSLMKYSFSEAKQKKAVSVIEMKEDGTFELQCRSLKPRNDMRELSGYLEELLDPSFYQSQRIQDYIKVTLLDEGTILDPMGKLRQVYPNILHLERKWDFTDLKRKQSYSAQRDEKKSELDLFQTFYSNMTDRSFDDSKLAVMTSVIEKTKREGDF
ncbi:exonuclease SbcCD subunit D [Peribacillus deserti]|uniref:Nuclease SbcCD subunit D n=1 Tax=Peribacillus deserti TaxID=673318 RepID=A0A2N5M284_9BACI|nr:exonuclease SbcCD subunit D [Peribacillus deserti]PLT28477.1 exonuclease sbcCD subunit D [Peribacillus deserti]